VFAAVQTTEHYFQAQKFVGTAPPHTFRCCVVLLIGTMCAGTELEEKIRTAGAPVKAKRLARQLRSTRRSDWEQVPEVIGPS
jgi:predicted NAD-dependent protein-ADP-ribosyltransferase YbiA (DUF1768 family)